MAIADHHEILVAKIKTLSSVAWSGECEWPVVEEWLSQFTGRSGISANDEQHEMLYLLSNFLYFGTREIKELLRASYRDCFRRRLIHRLRRTNGNTRNYTQLERLFQDELQATRFLPVGNPSESSSHLLYYFRQENGLPVRLFANTHELVEFGNDTIRQPEVSHYVFLDDFAGSGEQALDYARAIVEPMRRVGVNAQFHYYVLFATSTALRTISDSNAFDILDCVVEIGDEHQTFSSGSVYYMICPDDICKERAERVAREYGVMLSRRHPLGYRNGQLILGFTHNVPNNSLPIFWFSEKRRVNWVAPFVRHPKF